MRTREALLVTAGLAMACAVFGARAEAETVRVRPDRIDVPGLVSFEFGRAVLRPESLAVLDRLAAVLLHQPTVTLEVQVHTDSQGSSEWNYWLSHDRARAVVQYLVERGVEASRLTFQGYGEACPIAPNTTERGRRANRRVLFLRTDGTSRRECQPPPEPPRPQPVDPQQRPDDLGESGDDQGQGFQGYQGQAVPGQ